MKEDIDFEQEQIDQLKRQASELKSQANFLYNTREAVKDARVQDLLLNILDFSNINGNNYTGDNNDTNRRLGRAEVGFYLLGILEDVDPTLYPRMLLRHAKEKTK